MAECHSCGYSYAPFPFGSKYPDDNGICEACGKQADLRPLWEAVQGLPDKLETLATELEGSGGPPETVQWLRDYAERVRKAS